jgi:hypothetical protein
MTICPNHADVDGALQKSKLRVIHTNGVTKTYIKSKALTIRNSLLFFDVVYFSGELTTGNI